MWIERLKNFFAPCVKESRVGSMLAYQNVGKPLWTPRRYENLSEEGYRRNVIVFRCVNLIAKGAASVPWRLLHQRKELLHHPLLNLIHRPNPQQAGAAFIESVFAYWLLSGNSYIEIVEGLDGKPKEMYALRPDRMAIIPSADGNIQGYEYTVNGLKRLIPVPRSGPSPILHLKLFHPLNDWYGLSPMEAAVASIDQHNTVSSHNLAILQNGGRPSGALMVKTREHDTNLTDEQLSDLRQNLREWSEGPGNAGRIMVLEGDFQWQEMGLHPKDMDFIEGKNLSSREIAQAYGVPPMLVGVPGDATFANYREARYHLWEDTILPFLDHLVDEFNQWLVPAFGKDLRLSYDIDGIAALSSRREEAWAKFANASFLTINEKRIAMGYPPLPEGDKLGPTGSF